MALVIKQNGAYVAVVGLFVKKNGVYAPVVNMFVKAAGTYQAALGPYVPPQPINGLAFNPQRVSNNLVFA